jgi:tetratricopeptide (TPR) repeat protein
MKGEAEDQEIVAALALLDSSGDELDVQHYKDYRRAQILQIQGFFQESLPFLHSSFDALKKTRSDFTVERLYYSVGSLYASTLDHLGKYNEAEVVYKQLLTDNPSGDYICDYAVFLHRRKRDYQQAEAFFSKALELYPDYSSVHLKYAGFVRHVKRDPVAAEKHYRAAIAANPDNSEALGSFASFLHGISRNMDEAEKYYKLAIEKDDVHVNNLCNFGLFLR